MNLKVCNFLFAKIKVFRVSNQIYSWVQHLSRCISTLLEGDGEFYEDVAAQSAATRYERDDD